MNKPLSEVPESLRLCPFCKTKGEVVRVMTYGINNKEKQAKFECPECHHSWLYHTDD